MVRGESNVIDRQGDGDENTGDEWSVTTRKLQAYARHVSAGIGRICRE
jgi:hypothetical protein